MDDLTLKKHRLFLDLVALEAEFSSRVIMLNAEPPLIPESEQGAAELGRSVAYSSCPHFRNLCEADVVSALGCEGRDGCHNRKCIEATPIHRPPRHSNHERSTTPRKESGTPDQTGIVEFGQLVPHSVPREAPCCQEQHVTY